MKSPTVGLSVWSSSQSSGHYELESKVNRVHDVTNLYRLDGKNQINRMMLWVVETRQGGMKAVSDCSSRNLI